VNGRPCLYEILLNEPARIWDFLERILESPHALRVRTENLRMRIIGWMPSDDYTTADGMQVLAHRVPWVVYDGPWTPTPLKQRKDIANDLVVQFFLADGRLFYEYPLADADHHPLSWPHGTTLDLSQGFQVLLYGGEARHA
jgi:hypothetical protein